ncbi:hypothetical protein CERZMDRAFT_80827 [Cercospora zeae-maydis SCOH1-5]|uniref:C2H2-type domain-containing protein n=1 Tax=Cercospora zeae-maydis SCOH1-5 TaxID=717836 RepID=A0A6A6FTI5_9PEZI|nr:hypothetical protein CERZMDRAFT_80827 [Cercospora zeae-maydis SCOH1-5]
MVKRKQLETLESVLARPACYYCDRDFDDMKILHDHQKARHFLCQSGSCNRKLATIGGLRIHMLQVHKEELQEVPNAIEGRNDLTREIFGNMGAPDEWKEARIASVTQAYQKMAREHRLATGNPLPGQVPPEEASRPKRPRLEDEIKSGSLKAKVKALKAAREAEKARAAAAAAAGVPLSTPPPSTFATPPNIAAGAMPYPSMPVGAPPAPASLPHGSSFTGPSFNPVLSPPPGQFMGAGYGYPQMPLPFNGGPQAPLQGVHPLPPPPNLVPHPVDDDAAQKASADAEATEFLASLAAQQEGSAAPMTSAPHTPQPQSTSKTKSAVKGHEDLKLHDAFICWEEKRSLALGHDIRAVESSAY